MVGAVLTQNTNWTNVTKAIDNLRRAELLDYSRLFRLSVDQLAEYIRPSGYYNIKAGRLHNLLEMIDSCYGGKLDRFFSDEIEQARENLLSVKGVGPETADSILLYACGQPVFVIDAYTHRVLSRHNLVEEVTDYHTMQEMMMDHLPADAQLYNEFHALFVLVAKQFCKKTKPLCDKCPLREFNL
ncbi:MAG: endonuclease III domain-containing protein [Deltaproteobacteria bacterium]|nr:endonuclease III domain-containing protein [Deltaproteobacteria bacterium]MBW2659023.1 endonuclease III domain-containing protein [Deltaproteobacteria bacterium]